MANLRGIINRVVGGGAAGGRRTGGTPGPGRVGGPGAGHGAGGRSSTDEAIGRGVRGLLGKLRR
ncbi:hypothetical protein SAMN04488570_1984 [Nocardioides scoriae]|uniref:Uncharacterized protein n=1 Tax=Nocardioides scoriae TaxID=642780 RepID=A0A1H1SL15_9ACTN|nr:hypothetical protein [Nocardioides scoriae]SDS48632.1 hypothetical protein SAMN04488570_1984 [Nocardioides scoriae]